MTSRYYDEKNDDIQPGKISAELRAALNLPKNDVPIWIYRMRALGYPPGWLAKAIVDTSDIFDTDSPSHEGESEPKEKRGATQYDHSKLIEYPGFNTPLPPGTQDYHYYFNMPPMLPHQQLDYAKKTMASFKPAQMPQLKRKRTSLEPDGQGSSTKKKAKSSSNEKESGSSSEEDDEDDEDEDEEDEEEEEEEETPESPDTDDATNGNDKRKDTSVNSEPTKLHDKHEVANQSSGSLNSTLIEGIKLVSKGSPLPKPVERLPLERFSEGVVGDLLYFENIPNSTGKFESLRGILKTMRESGGGTDDSLGETSVQAVTSSTSTTRAKDHSKNKS